MKAVRRTTSALLLTIAMVFASLFTFSAPASATSDVDYAIRTTPTLLVTDNSDGDEQDITSSWRTKIDESTGTCTASNLSALDTAISSGSYTITQYYKGFSSHKFIEIQYSTNVNPVGVVFYNNGTHTGLMGDYNLAESGDGHTLNLYYNAGSYTNECSGPGDTWLSTDQFWAADPGSPLDASVFISNFTIEYPNGYEGELLPTMRRNNGAEYVAMGDSYSSGEGNSPYETFTDMSGVDECHRSAGNAYPVTLAGEEDLSLDFVACSGATTDTLLNGGSGVGAWNEPSQVDSLSSSTNVVTLTIGGNDVGFSEIITNCVNGFGCSTNTSQQSDLNDRLAALAGTGSASIDGHTIHSLLSVYEAVHTAAPNATIYVGGYPELFGSDINNYTSDGDAPGGAVCDIAPGAAIAYVDTQWMNDEASSLNGTIEASVDTAEGNGIDINYVPASFEGHALCDSGGSWLYGALLAGSFPHFTALSGSLHPTGDGQIFGYEAGFLIAMG